MKKLALIFITLSCVFTLPIQASGDKKEQPVQHLQLPDLTSMEQAQRVFRESTDKMQRMTQLDQTELEQIHIITYSLEKSVAYFVDNLEGERQQLAESLAVVVEEIHLASENNRQAAAREHLDEYFTLARRFADGL